MVMVSTPAFLNKQAKVLRKVWGLLGMLTTITAFQ